MGLLDSLKRMFTGAGGDYYQKSFGLEAGERVVAGGGGFTVPETSAGATVLAVVVGVMSGSARAGGYMGGATLLDVGEQFMFVLTSRGRLVLGMFGGVASDTIAFGPGVKPGVHDTGRRGGRSMVGPTGKGEPSRFLVISPSSGAPFEIVVSDSCSQKLLEWARV